jgi:hypothetical protein
MFFVVIAIGFIAMLFGLFTGLLSFNEEDEKIAWISILIGITMMAMVVIIGFAGTEDNYSVRTESKLEPIVVDNKDYYVIHRVAGRYGSEEYTMIFNGQQVTYDSDDDVDVSFSYDADMTIKEYYHKPHNNIWGKIYVWLYGDDFVNDVSYYEVEIPYDSVLFE